ncbi:G patch domain-containing protein 1 -like protein [Trichinella pseudospiralis]|uniref:Endonuclease III homolog n=1 Tax=Trichinella pseudospiralis TaxID=6337 RepID=A0A0V0XNT1_TRIPS|nr:G patch domain-containing protein 1 -like protein [Trichinella pseudospiralis]KRX89621.1 G patch domain-containing protein 1 -like protein [Trichinella pseudospiralis]
MSAHSLCPYGKPFDDVEEGEGIAKKPLSIESQIVTDEKGRRRFHGAFTGGFSAGYFNTVDTKEGWAPSSFKSSRTRRHEKCVQRPEDFMDNEDFSEFGIAPREIRTTHEYSDQSNVQTVKRRMAWDHTELFAECTKLSDLIRPVNDTFGMKLMRRMGWRPGRGVGPKLLVKNSSTVEEKGNLHKLLHIECEYNNLFLDEQIKVYGCSLPADLIEESSRSAELESVSSTQKYAVSADDVEMIRFLPKTDFHGLGYKGLSSDSSAKDTFTKTSGISDNEKSKGISGQAFGVGAFEEDDADIYIGEDLSKYDFVIGGVTEAADNFQVSFEFVLSVKKQTNQVFFPPPKVPPDFKPKAACSSSVPSTALTTKTPFERELVLDKAKSVFDYLLPKDRSRLMHVKASTEKKLEEKHRSYKLKNNESGVGVSLSKDVASLDKEVKQQLIPFPDQPAKQERFTQFLTYLKRRCPMTRPEELNEVQWEAEMNEFFQYLSEDMRQAFDETKKRAKPLASPAISQFFAERLKSKFTHAKHEEDDVKLKEEDDKMKAVQMKMFGLLTRESWPWHPDRQLCKRFNVPNPYPEFVDFAVCLCFNIAFQPLFRSSLVGVPMLKKQTKPLFMLGLELDASTVQTLAKRHDRAVHSTVEEAAVSKQIPVKKEAENIGVGLMKKSEEQVEKSDAVEREIEQEEEQRPPMSLFKCIFESDESDVEEELDEVEEDKKVEEKIVENAFYQKLTENAVVEQQMSTSKNTMVEKSPEPTADPMESLFFGPALPPEYQEQDEVAVMPKEKGTAKKTSEVVQHIQSRPKRACTRKVDCATDIESVLEAEMSSKKVISQWTPPHWKAQFENIQKMRAQRLAPVDTVGCSKLFDPGADEKTKRYQILLSLMLSSQTKDEITAAAMTSLKKYGCSVNKILQTDESDLAELIYPVGFCKSKAKYIKKTTEILQSQYDGDIPKSVDELCQLPGVGPKMALLTMLTAWNQCEGIAVDTHVHRISNRLGWLPSPTKQPEQTRKGLENWLPKSHWPQINKLLVGFGQTICLPVNPNCSNCLNFSICPHAALHQSKCKNET